MTNEGATLTPAAQLCTELMRAESADEVRQALTAAGYWDDASAWRLFGDNDNNYAPIGNQQAEPVAALVEKIINSVDARLVNAALIAGVDPEAQGAPESMRAAVARFFEGKPHPKPSDGRTADWSDARATSEGSLLTVTATGKGAKEGSPGLTIADQGEGQTPDAFPDTFMSVGRSNKLRIPFVQGKFNMGGTGALLFSDFQLVVSRRNPQVLGSGASQRDREWGFTIVRKFPPAEGARNSVYRYLAPVVIPGQEHRGVLTFAADEWPIFPEANAAVRDGFCRQSPYGSLVKLYEYKWQGTKSNIVLSGDGLLRRIDVGLPELALPVRIFECRSTYKGHAGSFATNALGLIQRLDRDRADKLEGGGPIAGLIALDNGETVVLRTYAFKDKDTAREYRTPRNGVVFGVNGQMHAAYPVDFFRRKSVNLSYLADSLLVYADCSALGAEARESLFMNSRDRMRLTDLAAELERKLEHFLAHEPELRALQYKRRQEAVEAKLEDDKPLSDVLKGLVKDNPMLNRLFIQGLKVPTQALAGARGGGVTLKGSADGFVGQRFPTYFRFKGLDDGEVLERAAQLEGRTRIGFETDAENDYFARPVDPGAVQVLREVNGTRVPAGSWAMNGPRDGIAQVWFDGMPPGSSIGDEVDYVIEVTDPSRIAALESAMKLQIVPPSPGGSGQGQNSKNANAGNGGTGGSGSALSLPNITPVEQADWAKHDFDDLSVLRVEHTGTDEDPEAPVYDFFVNVDNRFLRASKKAKPANAELIHKQFIYGFVLVGLALIQDRQDGGSPADEDQPSIESHVRVTSRALGPVLVPIIEAMGGLDDEP